MERIYEIRSKEVINIKDGARLGFISDLLIDVKNGRILKIIVPGPGKVFGIFGRDQEYQIPWDNINKIGEDIIIVDFDLSEKDYLVDM